VLRGRNHRQHGQQADLRIRRPAELPVQRPERLWKLVREGQQPGRNSAFQCRELHGDRRGARHHRRLADLLPGLEQQSDDADQREQLPNGATVTFHDPQGNSYVRTPTFLSAGQLSHQFNDGNDAGTWTVFATNPDGQTSNTLSFTVTASAPSISNVSPASYQASYNSQTMSIYGGNFQNGATVTFHDPQGNSYVRTPTFLSAGQLSHQFNDGNDAGTWTVFATNRTDKLQTLLASR